MRFLISRLILGLTAGTLALAQAVRPADLEKDVLQMKDSEHAAPKVGPAAGAADVKKDSSTSGAEDVVESTIFNGEKVPPLKELRADTFKDDVKDGWWYIKFYSPYCPHCQAVAPTFQTLYEFYYTSKPVPSKSTPEASSTSLNSFHGYYNFHFGTVSCVTWADFCSEMDIGQYPTFVLLKDGQVHKKQSGVHTMEEFSHEIEEVLETIRPGSRPVQGVKLPKPGDKSVDTNASPENPQAKDKNPSAGTVAGEKHNEIAAGKTNVEPEEQSKAESQKGSDAISGNPKKAVKPLEATKVSTPSKPRVTPNPAGTSIPLTQESFQRLVTQTQDPWFIKFYAPWCHHCQALAPNWHQMAREMQGELNIGEVNCDVERRLCKDVGVRAYPTIHFFRGGERVEYLGLRGLGDLVAYARKAVDVGMGVVYVDAAKFKEMEETEEVIFLYFFDHATTQEDFDALEHLTLSLVGHAKLVKTDSAILADRFKIHTWPRLVVSRDGRPSYYNALAPKDMRDFRQILAWMKSVWLPIVPELTASNSHEIMDGRFVVLGILSKERSDDFILDKRELKNAALEWMDREVQAFQLERQELRDSKQLRIEEADDRGDERALRDAKMMQIHISEQDRKQVGFAWVDGVFWERWLRTTYGVDIRDGERVIINDEDNRRYWDQTITGAPIIPSRSYILETLQKITADPPKIPPKYTTGAIEKVFFQAKGASKSHPFLALLMLAAAICIIVSIVRGKNPVRRARRGTGGFIQLGGKEGILGNGMQGKRD